MNKLNKAQRKEFLQHGESMDVAHSALEKEVKAYNALVREARAKVQAAQDEFARTIEDANQFSDGIADEIEQYMNKRSEKWHQSENGDRYSMWLAQWSAEICVEHPYCGCFPAQKTSDLKAPYLPEWDEDSYPPEPE